jgi:hypothetical protein
MKTQREDATPMSKAWRLDNMKYILKMGNFEVDCIHLVQVETIGELLFIWQWTCELDKCGEFLLKTVFATSS